MMKTKLVSMTYLGFTAVDKRFSNAMLPWLLREIRATGTRDKLSIAVEEGCLKAYNENFEPVIVHRLVDIVRASQVPGRPEELFYILLNEKEGLLNFYLFSANTDNEIAAMEARHTTFKLVNSSTTDNIIQSQFRKQLPTSPVYIIIGFNKNEP